MWRERAGGARQCAQRQGRRLAGGGGGAFTEGDEGEEALCWDDCEERKEAARRSWCGECRKGDAPVGIMAAISLLASLLTSDCCADGNVEGGGSE